MLILKKLVKSYIEKNQTKIIIEVLDDYNIRNKLNYFVINNFESNDIMLRYIFYVFKQKYNIDYNLMKYRLRYMSYVINLTIQIYLFDKYFNVEHRTIFNTIFVKKLNNRLTKYRKLKF